MQSVQVNSKLLSFTRTTTTTTVAYINIRYLHIICIIARALVWLAVLALEMFFGRKHFAEFVFLINFFAVNHFMCYFDTFSFVAKNLYCGKMFNQNNWLVSKIKKINHVRIPQNNMLSQESHLFLLIFFFIKSIIPTCFVLLKKTACGFDIFRLSRTNCSVYWYHHSSSSVFYSWLFFWFILMNNYLFYIISYEL